MDDKKKEEDSTKEEKREDSTEMDQKTQNARERLIGSTPGVFLGGAPWGRKWEQARSTKGRQTGYGENEEEGMREEKGNPLGEN